MICNGEGRYAPLLMVGPRCKVKRQMYRFRSVKAVQERTMVGPLYSKVKSFSVHDVKMLVLRRHQLKILNCIP